jgi:hypothetical protein
MKCIGLLLQHRIFSHPDFTVGFGFAPNQHSCPCQGTYGKAARGLMRLSHLPPVGNWPGSTPYDPTSPHPENLVALFSVLVKALKENVKINDGPSVGNNKPGYYL